MTMRALCIQQPWAWLIAHGYKDIENRTWPTKVRGDFLIHAGLKFDQEAYYWVLSTFPHIPMPVPEAFEHGGIVGRATLTDCVTASPSRWYSGAQGFVLANARPVPFIPMRGQLGFFALPPAVERAVARVVSPRVATALRTRMPARGAIVAPTPSRAPGRSSRPTSARATPRKVGR